MKIRPVGPELFRADGWTDEQTDMMNFSWCVHTYRDKRPPPAWMS